MAAYHFRAIEEPDLPEVSTFLRDQQEITSRDDPTQAGPSGDDLRWLLNNPDRRKGIPLGETLRTEDGRLAGMILSLPRMYRIGEKPMLGLAAGNLYVDASARMQGFFLLRRFFAMKGADFWYANSCNRNPARCGQVRGRAGAGVRSRVHLPIPPRADHPGACVPEEMVPDNHQDARHCGSARDTVRCTVLAQETIQDRVLREPGSTG